MNVLLRIAAVSRMNNRAIEEFLSKNYSDNNVLIYAMGENCEFNPCVKKKNIYNDELFNNREFSKIDRFFDFPPIDVPLMRKMSIYESEIYKMMDKYFPPIDSFYDRQRLYYDALRAMNGIIESNQINVFINFGIPHEVFDFITYCLCKVKGIETIMIYRYGTIRGYLFYFRDLEENIPDYAYDVKADETSLSKDFLEEYLRYKNGNANIRPYYMRNNSIKSSIDTLWSRAKAFNKYYMGKGGMSRALSQLIEGYKTKREIRRISIEPDLKKKFLYFPLQYQPEGTSSPGAREYVNLYLIAEILSYTVPDDIYVYIKSHPNQGIRGGHNREYYRFLNRLRNVIIVPTKYSTHILEDHCMAVVTGTGTVAYEAMYKHKPTLLFGYYIYNYMPGAFTIRSVDDCRKAIADISRGIDISDQQILDFVYNIDKRAYRTEMAIGEIGYMIDNGISFDECNSNTLALLADAIRDFVYDEA